jgi:hypothetical protein
MSVVLLVERDQDVLDRVVQPQRLHGPHLGPDYLGIAGRGDIQVEVLPAAERAKRHPAFPVDQTNAYRAVNGHGFFESRLHVHITPPFPFFPDVP